MPDVPFDRWGRVVDPSHAAGCYVLVEREKPDGWKVPPPDDAVRIWQRRPGAPDEHDDNCTVWVHEASLPEWFSPSGYVVEEWLPPGVEPDW